MKGLKRLGRFRLTIARHGAMRVAAQVYASDRILIEETALAQLVNAASIPGVHHALATPDIHCGYGVPIGAVVATDTKVIVPAAVGYDINCGMRLLSTPFVEGDLDLSAAAQAVARDIPLGEGRHNLRFKNKVFRRLVEGGMDAYLETNIADTRIASSRCSEEEERDRQHIEDAGSMDASVAGVSRRALERGSSQLGTLGGGNHFIEFQVVEQVFNEATAQAFGLALGQITVMIHSGSRGFGHEIGGTYMKLAKEATRGEAPSGELCFLRTSTRDGANYVTAMGAAANFAFLNRQIMTVLVRRAIRSIKGDCDLPLVYDVTHNMAKRERHGGQLLWVHRKGATRAYPASRMSGTLFADSGQPVLIPGSMGTASYVLVGLDSSAESLHSVNHGAGRVLSRSAARGRSKRKGRPGRAAAVSDGDFKRAMEGVHLICANRRSIKEEAPQAYKDIDEVIRVVREAGLARPVVRLRPLAVLKG